VECFVLYRLPLRRFSFCHYSFITFSAKSSNKIFPKKEYCYSIFYFKSTSKMYAFLKFALGANVHVSLPLRRFSFCHCIVCPSLIYGFWLLVWYFCSSLTGIWFETVRYTGGFIRGLAHKKTVPVYCHLLASSRAKGYDPLYSSSPLASLDGFSRSHDDGLYVVQLVVDATNQNRLYKKHMFYRKKVNKMRTATCWILTVMPLVMMSFSANRREAFISFRLNALKIDSR
jgi:hypothetical protein